MRFLRVTSFLLTLAATGCSDSGVPGGEGGAGGAASTTASVGGGAGTGGSAAQGVGGAGGAGGQGGGAAPDFDAIPWSTGDAVGFGIAFKDTENPAGESAFIGYAGYGVPLDAAEAWVRELYGATLKARGVRWVYAVQGPADVLYSGLEIGNSKVAASLGAHLTDRSGFVLVAAHSSGSFVAHELLGQLAGGLDPSGLTDGRVVYFDLDGGSNGLYPASVAWLRRAYFVAAHDPSTGTYSPNQPTMATLGATYASQGGYLELEAADAGCNLGAVWCLHMAVITSKPHDPNAATTIADYSDYAGRPVVTAYIDQKAFDAGL